MLSAKQGHYWYHFYYVFGMTRSLTGDWTRDLPHSKTALYHLAIEEAVLRQMYVSALSIYYQAYKCCSFLWLSSVDLLSNFLHVVNGTVKYIGHVFFDSLVFVNRGSSIHYHVFHSLTQLADSMSLI